MEYSHEHNISEREDFGRMNLSPAEQVAIVLENMLQRGKEAKQGVDQQFLDNLERIEKKQLEESDFCAICSEKYLDEKYPLAVKLPCPGKHAFDLQCVGEWLKKDASCPLCRHDFTKPVEKEPIPEDSEEEYDDMYL